MAFSENLQFIRTANSLTQEQLAEQLGVSRQSVSKWESGASFPEMDTLLMICDLYSTNLDTLLRGDLKAFQISDTAQYDAFMNRFSRRISFAVGGIIAGVALMAFLNAFALHEAISFAAFMLTLTICVVTLIASGIQEDIFKKKHPVIPDFYTEEEKDAFHQKFIWMISGGVGVILLDVVLLVLFFTVFPEREPYESLATALFLLIIAIAVSTLIYAGMQEDKYKIWKYNRDNNPTPEAKKKLDLSGVICGCIMLLAAAIYVALGASRSLWGSAWWLFAAGGILCGIVCTVLNPYKGDDD